MLRRDKYQPEIKLYYVEKHMSAEEEDEQEDKLLDRFNFQADGSQHPKPACTGLDSDNEEKPDDDDTSEGDDAGSPNSTGTKRKPGSGLQREHALEACMPADMSPSC